MYKEDCKVSMFTHYVCHDWVCVLMSDMCWFHAVENAKRRGLVSTVTTAESDSVTGTKTVF